MNAKENALRIINFDNPHRVVEGIPTYTLSYVGRQHEDFNDRGHERPVGAVWTDVWGTVWHKEQEGVMAFPREFPLANMESLRTYSWPDPDDERICGKIYRMAEAFKGGDVFLTGSQGNTLWEKAYMLIGMENLMIYFFTEPEFVKEVLHRIMDFQLGIAQHYMKLGIEMVEMGDDLGTQRGPLFSPRVMEEFFMPEYERLFSFYRERNVLIELHSCGNIESMLGYFMQLGVNVLNPIQATANDLDKVRAETQGRMALRGGVSSDLIMQGPVEKIVEEVRLRIRQLGREGGYFCAPDQGMPYPEEHIKAFSRAVDEYGRYPIQD